MSESDWWYKYDQDEFPDDVTPEEILTELTHHWSSAFNLISNSSQLIIHWEKSGVDGSNEKLAENISSAATVFNTQVQKARRYLNRRQNQ